MVGIAASSGHSDLGKSQELLSSSQDQVSWTSTVLVLKAQRKGHEATVGLSFEEHILAYLSLPCPGWVGDSESLGLVWVLFLMVACFSR